MGNEKTGQVTMKEVAEKAGVSIATVSRVLNGQRVTKELVDKVLGAAKELNYRPNAAARFMKGQKIGTLGLVVPDLAHPFFAGVASGVVQEACHQDQVVIISSAEGSREKEEIVIDQLSRSMLDGLIYVPVATGEPLPEVERFKHLPVVIAARRGVLPNRPHVYVDNVKGGYLATSYLIKLGRRRIAFLAGFWSPPCLEEEIPEYARSSFAGPFSSLDRFTGYQQALSEAGIPYDQNLVVSCGYDFQSGYNAARTLLGRLTQVDALLAANDLVASGAIALFTQQGFKVPEDISIIGYDDGIIPALTTPNLTSVHQDAKEIGAEAAKSLNRLLQGEKVEDKVIDVNLVIRRSTSHIVKNKALSPDNQAGSNNQENYA